MRSELDASFFRAVHEILAAPCEGGAEDRRTSPRDPYTCWQEIAPWDGQRFPRASEFLRVQCHDLTRRGFSFLMPDAPEFRQLVVRFRSGAQDICAGAEVVRTSPVWFSASGAGEPDADWTPERDELRPQSERARPMVLVGCRFTARLEMPAALACGTG